MRTAILGLSLLLLTGCATTATAESALQADIQKVLAFTQTDIQAALDDATKSGDTAAVNCYTVLLGVTKQTVTLPQIKGAVSAFQAGRDALSGSGMNGLAKQINIGCAALFVDATLTIGKIAAMTGVGLPPLPIPVP